MQVEVRPGVLYLFKGKEDGRVRELAANLRSAGYRLLVISAHAPGPVDAGMDVLPDCTLTITETVGESCVDPQNLMVLTDSIVKFIERKGPAAFLIEDLGALTRANEFPKVLRMIGLVYESLAMNRAIGIVVVDPLTLNNRDLSLLAKEGCPVEEKDRLDMRSLLPPEHAKNRPSQNV
jgi:hypothetical protein